MAIRIGTLRHRLAIQQRSTAQDSMGGQVTIWSTLAFVWGSIQPLSGHKLMTAQAVHSEVTHEVVVRWRPDLANPQTVAAMRIMHAGRPFNIRASMTEDESNRTLTLLTAEGMNDG